MSEFGSFRFGWDGASRIGGSTVMLAVHHQPTGTSIATLSGYTTLQSDNSGGAGNGTSASYVRTAGDPDASIDWTTCTTTSNQLGAAIEVKKLVVLPCTDRGKVQTASGGAISTVLTSASFTPAYLAVYAYVRG